MDAKDNASLTSRAQDKGESNLSRASGVRPKKNCYAPVKHNRLRRKTGHNYAGVCIYLITVNIANRNRLLVTLVGNTPDEAYIESSPLGEYVASAFCNMADIVTTKTGSRVQVLQYQIMPDHFHGILYVRDPLPDGWNLARMIAAWKGDCSREFWRISSSLLSTSDVRPEKSPLFEPNFNDKILFHEGQLQAWYDYLHDNPRPLGELIPGFFAVQADNIHTQLRQIQIQLLYRKTQGNSDRRAFNTGCCHNRGRICVRQPYCEKSPAEYIY